MKRFLLSLLLVIAFALPAFGANTVSYSWVERDGIAICTIDWIDDATNGIASTTISTGAYRGYVLYAVTDPGTTAPDANYDIAINDAYGADIFGGTLNNRSATASEIAEPLIPFIYQHGTLYLVISGQTVDDATGKIVIYFKTVD